MRPRDQQPLPEQQGNPASRDPICSGARTSAGIGKPGEVNHHHRQAGVMAGRRHTAVEKINPMEWGPRRRPFRLPGRSRLGAFKLGCFWLVADQR